MKKILVILGPTATGKTDLALLLAKKFNGEIVSSDSRQVYEGLDIGTGKLPNEIINDKQSLPFAEAKLKLQIIKGKGFWIIGGIKIWMYDVVDPRKRYTVFEYIKDVTSVIENIFQRKKLPIIVGGTGLYLKALIEGLPNLNVPINLELREELSKLSLEELQNRLKDISAQKWDSLNQSDRQNKRRLLRSIEIVSMNPYVQNSQNSNVKTQNWDVLKVGLTAPMDKLREKINLRLNSRLDQGMIKEAKDLYQNGLNLQRMKELGLEYGVLADLLGGEINQDQLVERLQYKIGQYAKRQLTWFKKEKNVNWFDITNQNLYKEVENKVQIWYDQP